MAASTGAPRRPGRRRLLCAAPVLLGLVPPLRAAPDAAQRRWYEAALAMRRQAQSSGDQPYGAVVVLDGRLLGEGPSRVVRLGDPDAHAEREAIKDAQRRLGCAKLTGAVLYSTSRPCPLCERAAAHAGIARMIHGEDLTDAGPPKP